jgi:hypothetical protein
MDAEDSDALFKLLLKALDRKLQNSKAAVTYDLEQEQITEIKGLVSHTGANNKTKYQILEKKAAATQKKRLTTPVAVAPLVPVPAATPLKELPPLDSSEGKNES